MTTCKIVISNHTQQLFQVLPNIWTKWQYGDTLCRDISCRDY